MTLSFCKMHGLGNDFVVIDLRPERGREDSARTGFSVAEVRAIADRHTGVGCDQFITIEPSRRAEAVAWMGIRNADGSTVAACGNATRCVAAVLMAESGSRQTVIETAAGLLQATAAADGMVTVDMGPARLDWAEIPLAQPMDTLHLDIALGTLADPVAVSMGNPHLVFFVPDVQEIPLEYLGPALETHSLFPARTNVEIATVNPDGSLRMRVWERGAGITRACGTGACAVLVAAARRGLVPRQATVRLDGGALDISWRDDTHVLMTGPVATSFTGVLAPELLAAVVDAAAVADAVEESA